MGGGLEALTAAGAAVVPPHQSSKDEDFHGGQKYLRKENELETEKAFGSETFHRCERPWLRLGLS